MNINALLVADLERLLEKGLPAAGNHKYIVVGPWGGPGGSAWNDGVHLAVRKLMIAYGSYRCIDSIHIVYEDDAKGSQLRSKMIAYVSGCNWCVFKANPAGPNLI
ncbi:conserved hypothetical protein [Ricinus communis]|uniref:Jacalin-type lectin domain-containing protein n=1 Tax=Ricinus communis TaxID=3988 RepID=B9R808_RICCO|nr:conserved hypothetical protein [Ricinus communis]